MKTGNVSNGVYNLVDGVASFNIGGFVVHINKTDEGVVCDIYDSGMNEAIASCYAFDSEVNE